MRCAAATSQFAFCCAFPCTLENSYSFYLASYLLPKFLMRTLKTLSCCWTCEQCLLNPAAWLSPVPVRENTSSNVYPGTPAILTPLSSSMKATYGFRRCGALRPRHNGSKCSTVHFCVGCHRGTIIQQYSGHRPSPNTHHSLHEKA